MPDNHTPPLGARLREVAAANPAFSDVLTEAADEIDVLNTLCDAYTEHIATASQLVDDLKRKMDDL